MSLLHIPEELKNIPNWVGWKTKVRDGKSTKVPYDINSNGSARGAKADDPSTWTTFERAQDATDILKVHDYDGIGFELGGADICGIDFDNAVTAEGVIDPYAVAILKLLGNPYTEVSPSCTGLHAFVKCDALPKGGRKLSQGHIGIEIYHGREGGRYFTVTGDKACGDGIPVIADISLPYMLITQNKDKKFKSLWLGDTTAFEGDDSSADFALMRRLAVLTQNDPVKMEKFFGFSVLGQRDKWRDRADYRQRTIKAAIDISRKDSSGPAAASLSELDQLIFTQPARTIADANYLEYVLAGVIDPEKSADDQGHEPWFPRGAVSLIGAPSGAGKTTLMYQMLLAQRCHGGFLGHASFGLSFVVMGADRGKGANFRTMRRMRLSPETLPFIGLATNFDRRAVQQIITQLEALSVMPAVVLVEGVDMLVTKVSDIQCVTIFMDLLHAVAERYHIAFICTLGSPKIKVGQGYAAKRDNMLGSSGWGRKCETYLNLQFPKSDDMDNRRILFMLPRNGKAEKVTLEFNHGQLERIPDIIEEELDNPSTELDWYQTQSRLAANDPTKRWFTVSDMKRALDLSHATAARHIGDALAKGFVKTKPGPKVGKGAAEQYQWNESESNPLWAAQRTQNDDESQEAFS